MEVSLLNNPLISIVANPVALSILSALHEKECPLSVYDFGKTYSVAQNGYALRRLRENKIVFHFRKNKRLFFTLNPFYKEKITTLVEFTKNFYEEDVNSINTFSPTLSSFLPLLKGINGWAIAGPTALDFWVPFHYLTGGKISFVVRSTKEKQKITQFFPKALLEIRVQPTYFIKTPKITYIDNWPVLEPEVLLFQLLKNPNARIRLLSVFLFPYLTSSLLLSKMHQEHTLFSTITYLLFCVHEYLGGLPPSSPIKYWFFNIDQYDLPMFFDQYMRFIGRKRKYHPKKAQPPQFFSNLRKQWKRKRNESNKWDQLVTVFRAQKTRFSPDAIEALINPAFYKSI